MNRLSLRTSSAGGFGIASTMRSSVGAVGRRLQVLDDIGVDAPARRRISSAPRDLLHDGLWNTTTSSVTRAGYPPRPARSASSSARSAATSPSSAATRASSRGRGTRASSPAPARGGALDLRRPLATGRGRRPRGRRPRPGEQLADPRSFWPGSRASGGPAARRGRPARRARPRPRPGRGTGAAAPCATFSSPGVCGPRRSSTHRIAASGSVSERLVEHVAVLDDPAARVHAAAHEAPLAQLVERGLDRGLAVAARPGAGSSTGCTRRRAR